VIVYENDTVLSKTVFIDRLIRRNVKNIVWVENDNDSIHQRYRLNSGEQFIKDHHILKDMDIILESSQYFLVSMLYWLLS